MTVHSFKLPDEIAATNLRTPLRLSAAGAIVPEPANASLYGGLSVEEAADGFYFGMVGPNPQGFTFWVMKVNRDFANPQLVFTATSTDRDTGTGVIKRLGDKLFATWVDNGNINIAEVEGFIPPPPPLLAFVEEYADRLDDLATLLRRRATNKRVKALEDRVTKLEAKGGA